MFFAPQQALDWERLGPERKPYSDTRRRRLAVQEAATALVATLQPAIEPVVKVTIMPREKYPLGQTVLKVNEQRELTHLFTRRYLEEQLLMVLAGGRQPADRKRMGASEHDEPYLEMYLPYGSVQRVLEALGISSTLRLVLASTLCLCLSFLGFSHNMVAIIGKHAMTVLKESSSEVQAAQQRSWCTGRMR